MKLIPNQVHSILKIFYLINPLNLFEYSNEKPSNLLKLNASATTFCRLFSTATFWRPKLARRLFAVLFSGKGRQKVANLFLSSKRMSKRHQKDAKRSATFFGRQKVPEQKSRQKVVALAFTLRYSPFYWLDVTTEGMKGVLHGSYIFEVFILLQLLG